jgi:transcriptional regulator with XRE-family HTH domain
MNPVEVGNRIKARRIALYKTVDDVCEQAGVSRSTWYRYEKGEIENISTKTMSNIAKVLNADPIDLLGIAEDEFTRKPSVPAEPAPALSERDIDAIVRRVIGYRAQNPDNVETRPVSPGLAPDVEKETAPDYDGAATAAMELLSIHEITETPINPLPIMLSYPGVRVMPYTRMASEAGMDREDFIPLFGTNQDAATFHCAGIGGVKYVVVYNMRLPYEIIWRAIARELGHVVLGHDGVTRSNAVRREEALCFAHHLICPRPILQLIKESKTPLTMNVLANTTGCSEECVDQMRLIPGAAVAPELNRKIKSQFARGISEYLRFHAAAPRRDASPLLDFGSYMDNYKE